MFIKGLPVNGFTIVELLTVVAIAGILVSLAFSSYDKYLSYGCIVNAVTTESSFIAVALGLLRHNANQFDVWSIGDDKKLIQANSGL